MSNEDFVEICRRLGTPQYKSMSGKEDRSSEGSAAGPPAADLVELIPPFAEAVADEARSAPAPWWCRPLCQHRSRCHGLALAKAEADPLNFVFAKQSPFQASFLQLRPRPRVLDCFGGGCHENNHDHVLRHMEFD